MLQGTRSAAVMGAASTLLLVACSSGPQPAPTGSVTTPATTASPSGTSVVTPLRLRTGRAVVRVSGDIHRRLALPLGPSSAYQPPPGQFSLNFLDRSANALIVNGATPSRTVRTSTALTLTVVIQAANPLPFPSAHGECTLHVTRHADTRFAASFACRKLSAGRKTINASGRFQVSK